MTDWPAALDQFDRRLVELRSVLEHDGRPASGTWPPADLVDEPIPTELVGRARALLAAAASLEAELVARRDELPPLRAPGVRHRRRPTRSTISAQL